MKIGITFSLIFFFMVYTTSAEITPCKTPYGQSGDCVLLKSCPSLLKLLNVATNDAIDTLQRHGCGFVDLEPKVCCPDFVEKPESNDDDLLPRECGNSMSQKIFGGEVADIAEFPWLALLEYADKDGAESHGCGGVLISKRYVLTAAHCVNGRGVYGKWSLLNVRLGEFNLTSPRDCFKDDFGYEICADDPLIIPVEEKIVHENFPLGSANRNYDIALLRLSRDVLFTDYIAPICLPKLNAPTLKANQKCQVAGWGRTESGRYSDVKKKVSVPIVEKSVCQEQFSKLRVTLEEDQMCAGGESGNDSCDGDSGNPLMVLDEDEKWICRGIVSFGQIICGRTGWPGIYSDVSYFMPWILKNMRK